MVGDPAELGHLLLAGQPEGLLQVPLVHEDELGAAHGSGEDRRHAADVEQRTDRERGGLEGGARRPAAQQRLAGAAEGHVPDVRHHPAVGEEGALGATGRARRVEHGDDVVAPDPDDGVGVDLGTGHQVGEGHVATAPLTPMSGMPAGRPWSASRSTRSSSRTATRAPASVRA